MILLKAGKILAAACMVLIVISHMTTVSAEPNQVSAKVISCLNERVDVYLTTLMREEGPPIRIFLKPGPPLTHLRLPRDQLTVHLLPNVYGDNTDCNQKSFTGFRALYNSTSTLARGLGVPYYQPKVSDGQISFFSRESPNQAPGSTESLSRDIAARKGSWIIGPDFADSRVNAKFCLPAPDSK